MLTLLGPGFGYTATATILDHSKVPFRGQPVYLRLVTSMKRALDYAAAGFHVSVTRGLAGGCVSPWSETPGTRKSTCPAPRERADLEQLWAASASAYFDAFSAAQAGADLASVIDLLRGANQAADAAYGAEGIEPPRDPQTQESQGAAMKTRRRLTPLGATAISAACLGALGFALWTLKDKDRKPTRRSGGGDHGGFFPNF